MRRPPAVDEVAEQVGARLHGAEEIIAFGIGQRTAAPAEIGVDRRHVPVVHVAIAPARIRLPDLDEGVRHAAPVLVEHAPWMMVRSPMGSPSLA